MKIVHVNSENDGAGEQVFRDVQKVQLLGMEGGCPVLSIVTKDRKNYVWPLFKLKSYVVEDILNKEETDPEHLEKTINKEYYDGMVVTKF